MKLGPTPPVKTRPIEINGDDTNRDKTIETRQNGIERDQSR